MASDKIFYSEMKLPELKKLLKERGLKITGKKAELIERLEEYDKEFLRENEGGILLFCKHMSGSYCDVRVFSWDTVLTLKNKIYNKTGYPVHKIVLSIIRENHPITLQDELKICDYALMSESTVFMNIKL